MLNSVVASRRLAQRAAASQALATLLVALGWWWQSPQAALAALVGGGALTVGSWASARVALGGGVVPAGAAFVRLLAGLALKWLLVIGGLVVGLGMYRLPPLPLVTGVMGAALGMALAGLTRPKVSLRE